MAAIKYTIPDLSINQHHMGHRAIRGYLGSIAEFIQSQKAVEPNIQMYIKAFVCYRMINTNASTREKKYNHNDLIQKHLLYLLTGKDPLSDRDLNIAVQYASEYVADYYDSAIQEVIKRAFLNISIERLRPKNIFTRFMDFPLYLIYGPARERDGVQAIYIDVENSETKEWIKRNVLMNGKPILDSKLSNTNFMSEGTRFKL